MTRTFKLLLTLQPVRRTPQMRADRLQGRNLLLTIVFSIDNPHAKLGLELRGHGLGSKVAGKAHFEVARWLGQDIRKHESGEPETPEPGHGGKAGEPNR